MKKNLNFKTILFGVAILLAFGGCNAVSNYDVVNPTPKEIQNLSQGSEVLKNLYIEQGRLLGVKEGFKKGLDYSKDAFAELMNDIRAKQFSVYLYKERFIEAGPTYINPKTGEIELGQMEIRKPFTVADIYKYYGAEIPIMSDEKIKEELEKINDKLVKVQSSISPDIIKKTQKRHIINRKNVNGFTVRVYNTKSNQDLLTKLNYTYGAIDDKLIVKFDNTETANNFCMNFGCITN